MSMILGLSKKSSSGIVTTDYLKEILQGISTSRSLASVAGFVRLQPSQRSMPLAGDPSSVSDKLNIQNLNAVFSTGFLRPMPTISPSVVRSYKRKPCGSPDFLATRWSAQKDGLTISRNATTSTTSTWPEKQPLSAQKMLIMLVPIFLKSPRTMSFVIFTTLMILACCFGQESFLFFLIDHSLPPHLYCYDVLISFCSFLNF